MARTIFCTPSAGLLAGRGHSVLVTARGTGLSRCGAIALTGSPTDRRGGLLTFVRDLDTGEFWALGQGSGVATVHEPGVFTIVHDLGGLRAELEVCAAPDWPLELRRLTLTDLRGRERRLDVTTCAEIILHHPGAHAAHPGFSRLFLQTESDGRREALLAHRRPREPRERFPWLVHAWVEPGSLEFETDRARFAGRGHARGRPAAMLGRSPLSGTAGNVLDPIASLRRQVHLDAHGAGALSFLLGAADDREEALALVDQARRSGPEAILAAARSHALAQLQTLGIDVADHGRLHDLGGAVMTRHRDLRAPREVLARAGGDPRRLFARLELDPALPLIVADPAARDLDALARARRLWHELGLVTQVLDLEADRRLTPAEHDLLEAAAVLVVRDRLPLAAAPPPAGRTVSRPALAPGALAVRTLRFENGLGGFSDDGREYVIRVRHGEDGGLVLPPQPWVNVIANEALGCIVSETGAGATWCGNSRENRLTPWANDPVRDPHGEAFYIRDADTGAFWSCLPGPAPGAGDYEVRHGWGYSRCLHAGDGLEVQTLIFVAAADPVRLARVRIRNAGRRARRVEVHAFAQLVLGDLPDQAGRYAIAAVDDASDALLARNRAAGPYADHVAFGAVAAGPQVTEVTHGTSRWAFLGRELDPATPSFALSAPEPAAAGDDAAFVHRASLELAPDATGEVTFVLGQAADAPAARTLAARYRRPEACADAWQEARNSWRDRIGGLEVETPSAALNLMLGGWLAYQTLSCRLWGRTALYQSGGAYGFRDQLQDALALLPLRPELARAQILLHAGHQFVEGDVLHWWHPPLSRGIRTRFADDLLWLPYLTAQYVAATGDESVLAERVGYFSARPLAPGEDEAFLEPTPAADAGDLYDHCCRALDRSLAVGAHGLPLFGTGDWNDGLNRVGREGRGESAWMGFFLVAVIDAFAPLCVERGDHDRAGRYREHRRRLAAALNDAAWDGDWYLRGFYDDGAPLGSHRNTECRIDALVQAWAVLSGIAPAVRVRQALDALEEHLISESDGLIRLLTPPFIDTPHDPGYIKGYVAGVRENGGQYTHAALWVVRAMAEAGRRNRAAALLDLLNPILHAASPDAVARYQVEPYVIAADVYGSPPHVGRGGWTWYTGSSGWMLRVAIESILGLRTERGDTLVLAPCIPDAWPGYRLAWCVPGTTTHYEVEVVNPDGCSQAVVRVVLDGQEVGPDGGICRIPLLRDGRTHVLRVELGPRQGERA